MSKIHVDQLLLFIFAFLIDKSLAELSLLSNTNTNGSYCPGKVNLTCVGTNVPIGLSWRVNGSNFFIYTFIYDGTERFPEVVYTSNIASITVVDAVLVPPGSLHNITSELTGNMSNLISSTILCRTVLQESDTFIILPRIPRSPHEVNITIGIDNDNDNLMFINLSWRVSPSDCPGVEYFYTVVLQNEFQHEVQQTLVRCKSTQLCVTRFAINPTNETFRIEITASNNLGQSTQVPYLSKFFNYQNLSMLTTTSQTITSSDSVDLVLVIAGSIAGFIVVVLLILGIIVLCILWKRTGIFKSEQVGKSIDVVYDEVGIEKKQPESKNVNNEGYNMSSNECYKKTLKENINMENCVAYSALK